MGRLPKGALPHTCRVHRGDYDSTFAISTDGVFLAVPRLQQPRADQHPSRERRRAGGVLRFGRPLQDLPAQPGAGRAGLGLDDCQRPELLFVAVLSGRLHRWVRRLPEPRRNRSQRRRCRRHYWNVDFKSPAGVEASQAWFAGFEAGAAAAKASGIREVEIVPSSLLLAPAEMPLAAAVAVPETPAGAIVLPSPPIGGPTPEEVPTPTPMPANH